MCCVFPSSLQFLRMSTRGRAGVLQCAAKGWHWAANHHVMYVSRKHEFPPGDSATSALWGCVDDIIIGGAIVCVCVCVYLYMDYLYVYVYVGTCVCVYVLCVGVCLWGEGFIYLSSKVQRRQRTNHKTEFLHYDTMSLQVYIPIRSWQASQPPRAWRRPW